MKSAEQVSFEVIEGSITLPFGPIDRVVAEMGPVTRTYEVRDFSNHFFDGRNFYAFACWNGKCHGYALVDVATEDSYFVASEDVGGMEEFKDHLPVLAARLATIPSA
jgi:hypothetical protein